MTTAADLETFKKLDQLLRTLPQRGAARLQRAMRSNGIDHVGAVRKRSTFSPESNRRMASSIRIEPKTFNAKTIKLKDVYLDEFTRWGLGREDNPKLAAAARIEKRVGLTQAKPTGGRRFLGIPAGILRTPQGRVKRKAGKQVELRDQPNTKLIKLKGGNLLVVLDKNKGRRSKAEATGDGGSDTKRKQHAVVGILVKGAFVRRGLDYFDSWDSLERNRDDRYDRMLLDIAGGYRPGAFDR